MNQFFFKSAFQKALYLVAWIAQEAKRTASAGDSFEVHVHIENMFNK